MILSNNKPSPNFPPISIATSESNQQYIRPPNSCPQSGYLIPCGFPITVCRQNQNNNCPICPPIQSIINQSLNHFVVKNWLNLCIKYDE